MNNFNKNYTIGIEEEYMICDSNTGNLIDKATEIMPLIPKSDIERFSYELIHSEIESNTKICDNVIEASQEVIKYRNLLKDIGLKINCLLIKKSET